MSNLDSTVYRQRVPENYSKMAFSVSLTPSGAITPRKDCTLWLEIYNSARARILLLNELAGKYARKEAVALCRYDEIALLLSFSPTLASMLGTAQHVSRSWDLLLLQPPGGLTGTWPYTKEPFEPFMGVITRPDSGILWTWDADSVWKRQLAQNFPGIHRPARP